MGLLQRQGLSALRSRRSPFRCSFTYTACPKSVYIRSPGYGHKDQYSPTPIDTIKLPPLEHFPYLVTMPFVHNSLDDVSLGVSKQDTVDYARPMKVIVIGAGISGILAAIRFPQRIPNLSLVVYDKNPEVGGTWYENRYPGAACGKSLCQHLSKEAQLTSDRYPCACIPSELRIKPQLVRILRFKWGNPAVLEGHRCKVRGSEVHETESQSH